jgi:predicted RNA-binding Zn ribbon-like protein
MHINPYGEDAVRLAVDLANNRPRTASELHQRCRDAGLEVTHRVTRADLDEVLELLDEWVAVIDAADEQQRVERLNALLAAYASHPRITNHAGTGWHLHFRDEPSSFIRVLAVIVTTGTALHLVGRGMHRLGRCGAEDCEVIYADLSRNGTQRYCSPSCGNRDAVRRHRARTSRSA